MIAVVSDIHANLPALQAVLADIGRRGVERIWCLGDTTGYGPFVNECLDIVSQRCELVLAGNHDLAVRGDVDIGVFGGTAGAGVEYARKVISHENVAHLRALRTSRSLDGVELYHASSRDPVWEYVRSVQSATGHLRSQGAALSLVGHSHIQLTYAIAADDRDATAQGGAVPAGTVIPLRDGEKRVVNPGSVGQPRDRDPRAAWALIEPGGLTMHRVSYDIGAMRSAVREAGLPTEIGERLELGW